MKHEVINTSKLRIPVQSKTSLIVQTTTLMTVLVEDANDMYACYQAVSDYNDHNWVAHHGRKLTWREAKSHFPNINPERYRR